MYFHEVININGHLHVSESHFNFVHFIPCKYYYFYYCRNCCLVRVNNAILFILYNILNYLRKLIKQYLRILSKT